MKHDDYSGNTDFDFKMEDDPIEAELAHRAKQRLTPEEEVVFEPENTLLGEFQKERTEAISEMFDGKDDCGIYPTTKFFVRLDNCVRRLLDAQLAKADKHKSIKGEILSFKKRPGLVFPPEYYEHRLDRPDREKIEQAVYDYVYIGLNDANLPYLTVQPEFYTTLLALFDEEEIRKQIEVLRENLIKMENKLDDREIDLIEAKREEWERMMGIIEEYGLDKVSARDDTMERQAKGWKALKSPEGG